MRKEARGSAVVTRMYRPLLWNTLHTTTTGLKHYTYILSEHTRFLKDFKADPADTVWTCANFHKISAHLCVCLWLCSFVLLKFSIETNGSVWTLAFSNTRRRVSLISNWTLVYHRDCGELHPAFNCKPPLFFSTLFFLLVLLQQLLWLCGKSNLWKATLFSKVLESR